MRLFRTAEQIEAAKEKEKNKTARKKARAKKPKVSPKQRDAERATAKSKARIANAGSVAPIANGERDLSKLKVKTNNQTPAQGLWKLSNDPKKHKETNDLRTVIESADKVGIKPETPIDVSEVGITGFEKGAARVLVTIGHLNFIVPGVSVEEFQAVISGENPVPAKWVSADLTSKVKIKLGWEEAPAEETPEPATVAEEAVGETLTYAFDKAAGTLDIPKDLHAEVTDVSSIKIDGQPDGGDRSIVKVSGDFFLVVNKRHASVEMKAVMGGTIVNTTEMKETPASAILAQAPAAP